MSSPAISAPQHTAPPEQDTRRWWALAVIALAQLMVVLDATIVSIALPSAQRDLGLTDGSRQWVVTAYTLAFGGLLLLGGRVVDLIGRKRAFVIGLVGFAAASALGGAATGPAMLFAARALQGAFAALLAPSALSLMATTFTDGRERAKAFGIFGALAAAGGGLGLLLTGADKSVLSVPDERVTTAVDVRPWLDRKWEAILAHGSEVRRKGSLPGILVTLPARSRDRILATEYFTRVDALVLGHDRHRLTA
jgi:sugar phosphate permease